MANKFIKVTPKGEKQPRIVLATLKAFYLSQGAKVEIPTDEEVYAAEPTERPRNTAPAQPTADQAKEIELLRKANTAYEERDANLRKTIEQQAAELADLRGKLEAAETTITESEKVIENLRKELAKTETKANKKAANAQ